jgi:DNA-binding SARP family transcriptional activator/Tfp pilus assembly protein PilF
MWFGVLGPLLVRDGESVISVPAGRQRVLLAALLVRAGEAVPMKALAEAMWEGSPPSAAGTTLRSHVMRLRRVLGPVAGARVVTRYPGYVVEASDGEVDVLRFRGLCRGGGAAVRTGDWARAWEMLSEALGLWRGEPLADIPSELLRRDEVPGLEQLRLQAMEWRMDAGLELGHHVELAPELRSLAREYPLRERFAAQLMLAQYRCGRHAEALATYQQARRVLAEALGTDPGTELRRLHQRMLAADRSLDVPGSGSSLTSGTGPAAPRQLPAPVAHFTGRARELATLTRLLDQPAEPAPPAVVISAIGGTAGVGKTALAVHWAHQVADRFPDGQLYVNMRGYDPKQPMTAADALAGFLRALGMVGHEIPPEEDDRAAQYRSLLAGKRMLIVLDNARSAEQVRPLLPGSRTCAVLVTSRDLLAGLVARHGATRLDLDLLPLAEAVRLLRELIGARACADPGAAAAIAEHCCRLPLALRIAAELAAVRPDTSLAGLASELADQQKRLDLLEADGDPRTAVRAVFSWSYRHLDADAARVFRLAGLHPGPDFGVYAAAALADLTREKARRVLDTLVGAHLIQAARPDRYGLHDLLRAYACELAARDGEEQRVALTRLFDHYLHTAAAAMDSLYPAERHRRPCVPSVTGPAPPVTAPAAARCWLDAERPITVAVMAYAAQHGWTAHATRLAATLSRYLDSGGHYPEAIAIHSHACAAAHQAGDRAAEANALNCLASVHWRQSRYQQAASHLQQALALFRQTGDRIGEAHALKNLGLIYYHQGRYQGAIGLHQEALDIYRETGESVGTAIALGNLGLIEERLGRYDLAAGHHQQALAIASQYGARGTECDELVNLGTVSLRQGRYRDATGYLDRALALCREVGYRDVEAEAFARLGDVCLRQGRTQLAARHLRQALALYRDMGNRSGEADALNSLGEVLLADGQPGDSGSQHVTALSLAAQIGDRYQQARAHHGLGQADRASGDRDQAELHWQQALALFTELGTPEADQVRACWPDNPVITDRGS